MFKLIDMTLEEYQRTRATVATIFHAAMLIGPQSEYNRPVYMAILAKNHADALLDQLGLADPDTVVPA